MAPATATRRAKSIKAGALEAKAANEVAMVFKQISDPTRVRIISILGETECNVTDLCTRLGNQSQPAVSHHLALLRHGRVIESRRQGKNNFYGLTDAGRDLASVITGLA